MADRRELAFVPVPERLMGSARDRTRRVASLLHRNRRHAVKLLPAHGDHVAEREHLGMTCDRQVGLDGDPPGAIGLRP